MKTLTTEMNIDYIDMNHIMGPLWDSALDFCHPKGAVFTAEVEWILYSIFTHSVERQEKIELFPAHARLPDHTLVRFTGSQSVYLIENDGVLRAFPNGHTFMAMGYDFGDVKTEFEFKMRVYTMGTELPNL